MSSKDPPSDVRAERRFQRGRRRLAWVLGLVVAGAVLTPAGLLLWPLRPELLALVTPAPDQLVGVGGVEVIVSFPDPERVRASTFRVLLNGIDITEEFTTADNGAYARIAALLDGENVLRFEIFGEGYWPRGVLVEEAREVRILMRPPLFLHRG